MVIVSLSSRQTATTVAATVGAVLLVCSVQSPSAQESRREPPRAAAMPERFSRQVAPTPSTYWRSPDLRGYTGVLKSTEAPPIDSSKRYALPELIDLVWQEKIEPGKVFDLRLPLERVAEGYRAMDERRAIKTLLIP